MIDLPPAIQHNEIPRQCIVRAAASYQLPLELIGGILYVEGGRLGMANKNRNGSFDYGPAQINSAWLPTLKDSGIDAQALQHDPCKNLWVAGWILRRCLDKFASSFWHGVGCYHTGENPKRRDQLERQAAYAGKVARAAARIRGPFIAWLNGTRTTL